MSPLPERVYSAKEYLALERAAEHESELVNGRIHAMAGASFEHNRIVNNIVIGVGAQLRGGDCSVL